MIDQALACLAQTIFMEARGESHKGQVAVGYVLMRRAEFKPERICLEMARPAQFSWYGKLKLPEKAELKPYYLLAWRVMYKLEPDYSKGATHFHNFAVNPRWNMKPRVTIQNHIFY
jgi:hypothetical protein